MLKQGSSVDGVAYADDSAAYRGLSFVCKQTVSFISNDSDSYALLFNLDAPVGQAGTVRLRPGEILSDYPVSCNKIYVQGVGADVPFRAVGV